MEKKKKEFSLTEIILLIVVSISVILILVDMAINIKNEIELKSQNNGGEFVLLAAGPLDYSNPDWVPLIN